MSMTGSFGLCPKNSYDSLINFIKAGQSDAAQDLVKEIWDGLEDSASMLENNRCSGEVFLALFEYFKAALDIDIRENADLKKVGENWREITGDYDMAVFTEKEKTQFLSRTDSIHSDQVTQFVNDFFQNDYGEAGQTACDVFIRNLEKLGADSVLIWHLY